MPTPVPQNLLADFIQQLSMAEAQEFKAVTAQISKGEEGGSSMPDPAMERLLHYVASYEPHPGHEERNALINHARTYFTEKLPARSKLRRILQSDGESITHRTRAFGAALDMVRSKAPIHEVPTPNRIAAELGWTSTTRPGLGGDTNHYRDMAGRVFSVGSGVTPGEIEIKQYVTSFVDKGNLSFGKFRREILPVLSRFSHLPEVTYYLFQEGNGLQDSEVYSRKNEGPLEPGHTRRDGSYQERNYEKLKGLMPSLGLEVSGTKSLGKSLFWYPGTNRMLQASLEAGVLRIDFAIPPENPQQSVSFFKASFAKNFKAGRIPKEFSEIKTIDIRIEKEKLVTLTVTDDGRLETAEVPFKKGRTPKKSIVIPIGFPREELHLDYLQSLWLTEQGDFFGLPVLRRYAENRGYSAELVSIFQGANIQLDSTLHQLTQYEPDPSLVKETWRFITDVATEYVDPMVRAYALHLAARLMELSAPKKSPLHPFSPTRATLLNITVPALKSENAIILWNAGKIFERQVANEILTGGVGAGLSEQDLSNITVLSFLPPKPLVEPAILGNGIGKYLVASRVQRFASDQLAMDIVKSHQFGKNVLVSLDALRPLESVGDFHPDPQEQSDFFQKAYQAIVNLRREGIDNRVQFFKRLLSPEETGMTQWEIRVIAMGSGDDLVLEGKDFLAALHAARKGGIIPADWVRKVPVKLAAYRGTMPEALVTHLLSLGVTLTWDDEVPLLEEIRPRLPENPAAEKDGANGHGSKEILMGGIDEGVSVVGGSHALEPNPIDLKAQLLSPGHPIGNFFSAATFTRRSSSPLAHSVPVRNWETTLKGWGFSLRELQALRRHKAHGMPSRFRRIMRASASPSVKARLIRQAYGPLLYPRNPFNAALPFNSFSPRSNPLLHGVFQALR